MIYFFRIYQYLLYLLKAKGAHAVQAPFLYHFITEVLHNKHSFYAFEEIESIRAKLLLSNLEIDVNDLGAGSQHTGTSRRKVSSIARHAAKNEKYAQLLFRVAQAYNKQKMLELGTSLGVSAMYLASAHKNAQLITIEGCRNCTKIAELNFSKLGLTNIQTLTGNFDYVLPELLKEHTFDLFFIDGNHRGEALLKYTDILLPNAEKESIFIIDDIRWNKDMYAAWNILRQKKEFTLTLDLYQLGICFTNPALSKEHFIIRY